MHATSPFVPHESAPARSAPPSPGSSPSIPSACEHDVPSPEPYWPRLARALVVMFLAICLHVWGVHAPEPQEPVYSLLASRVISSVFVSPPLPLAPPLQLIPTRRAHATDQRVTLRTTLLNVPALPAPPAERIAVREQLLAVGTTGAVTGRPVEGAGLAPRSEPTAPMPSTSATSATSMSAASVSAASVSTPSISTTTAPAEVPTEPRLAPALMPLTSIARETPRSVVVVLPADRVEPDPRGAQEQQLKQKEVLAVVHEYTRALERLDVRATKAVYPSADDRRLKASFRDLEAQQIHLDSCGVSFSSSGDANARCKGNATYRPKVGSRVGRPTKMQEWVFSLSQDGGGWQILEARVQ